ncbi:UNVERIFIED_CONTAM: hypothetical protein RKD43_003702 [Streptomyces graminofaciens]
MERSSGRRHRGRTRRAGAPPADAPGGGGVRFLRQRIPRGRVRGRRRVRRPGPVDAPFRSRTPRSDDLAHGAQRSVRPALDHDRVRRAASGAARRGAAVARLDARQRVGDPARHRFPDRRRRTLLDRRPRRRRARAAARPAAGGRFRTAPAGPPRVAAHAVAAHRLRRRTRRGRGPPGRHADRQPAGHGRRVVLPAPGGPRLLPRGRTVRRVRLDPLLRRAARLADAPAALAAGGSAAAVQG